MDGKKIKTFLEENQLTIIAAAQTLNMSRQTLDTWIRSATLTLNQRKKFISAFSLAENFFESNTVIPHQEERQLFNCLSEKELLYKQVIQLQKEKSALYEKLVASEAEKVKMLQDREKVKAKQS